MEDSPTMLVVVAGVLHDAAGRVLLQKRPAEKQHGGLWEFPGGKVEPGESPRTALVRELNEELGITVDAREAEPLAFAETEGRAGGHAVVILLYTVRDFSGNPVAREGAEIAWFSGAEAARLPMPPLDIDLLGQVSALRKSPRG